MTRFTKNPSQIYLNALDALKQLVKEEGDSSASRVFADATEKEKGNLFISTNNIIKTGGNHVCIYRLLGKSCPGENCDSPQIIPHADHSSEWIKNGKTEAIVSQPYGLSYSQIKEIVNFCEEKGLEFTIDASSSWHFPSKTLLLQFQLERKQ